MRYTIEMNSYERNLIISRMETPLLDGHNTLAIINYSSQREIILLGSKAGEICEATHKTNWIRINET